MRQPERTVLFDAPGPRGRQRTMVASIIAGLVLLGVGYLVYRRLDAQGQFTYEKWGPLFDPNNEVFSQVWNLIREGLEATLQAAAFAMLFSLVIGTLLAVTRITSAPWYRWLVVGFIELFRGLPVVIAIFLAARVLPELGVELPLLWYLVIGLTFYNSVVIAEIIRSGVAALPRGQTEAAYALGLTRGQTLRLVLLPQAFRIMLPALISQLVVVLKDTSLGAFISYQELVRTGNILVQNLANPIQTYLLIGAIFIVVNYLLSKLAVWVERRMSGRTRRAARAEEPGLEALEVSEGLTPRPA
jgi:glutamate transport system permease protein